MLRTRLVLGLLCLLVILLAMGLYAIDRCSRLGDRIQIILDENYQSIRALQEIKNSSLKTTSAILANDIGKPSFSQADFLEACQAMEKNLARQQEGVLDKKGKTAAENLRRTLRAYTERGRQLYSLLPHQKLQYREFSEKIQGSSYRIQDLADAILESNQMAIKARNELSGKEINTTIRLIILAMIAAVVIAIYASFRLTRGLLEPLASLTTSIQQIGAGNLDQKLNTQSRDELGTLASSFNTMALQLKAYRDANTGRVAQLNRTIQQTIASFPDPIFVLNKSGEVEFRNPPADGLALKLLFAGVGRLPGTVEDLVARVLAESKDYLPTLLKDAIRFHFDNKDHYFLPRIILLRNENETPFGVAVILENITQVLLLDEIKTNLISTVSHELKTPLTSVRLALYLLLENSLGSLNEEQKKLLSTARDDADRLLKTLNDLLDLTRLEAGSSQLNREFAPPDSLITAAIQDVRDLAQAANQHIRLEMDPALPDVAVDRQRIAYVFANLLSNACKYSPPGSEIFVRVEKTPEGLVCFSVRDQGPGIAPDHQHLVFEKFFRVPGTTKTGTGLGLSIAREIVRAHDGTIGLESQPGAGTRFYVVLRTAPS
jgi:NtrC-family two-component system sensor histidine kinase KinB